MSVKHTLHVKPEGYLEPYNKVGSQRPSQCSPLVGFQLKTFQFCVLYVIPLCQRPHMKSKKNKIIYEK